MEPVGATNSTQQEFGRIQANRRRLLPLAGLADRIRQVDDIATFEEVGFSEFDTRR